MTEIVLIVFGLALIVFWVVYDVLHERAVERTLPPVAQRPSRPVPSWVHVDTRRARRRRGRHARREAGEQEMRAVAGAYRAAVRDGRIDPGGPLFLPPKEEA